MKVSMKWLYNALGEKPRLRWNWKRREWGLVLAPRKRGFDSSGRSEVSYKIPEWISIPILSAWWAYVIVFKIIKLHF